MKRISKDLENKIIKCYLEPNNSYTVSKIFNVSRKTVIRVLERNNVPVHNKETLHSLKVLHNKQTCLNKYGVCNVSQLPDHKIKSESTCLTKYGATHYNKTEEGKSKFKQTCLKKYGVSTNAIIDECVAKRKQTCLKRYGSEYASQTQECLLKIFNTKKKNHTFNSSKPEEEYYKYLMNKFGKDEILIQYRDKRYPYNCDFYIKSLDLFIELNLHWTHGGHPFDENNKEDLEKLKSWKEKAKKSIFYQNAINTWTVSDINKKKIAKENNLNYVSIYDKNNLYSTEY